MSADTEEVTPSPDVTLGKQPQSKVQSLITLWSNMSMEQPLSCRRRRPASAGNLRAASMMTPPSFKRQPVRRSSRSLYIFRNVESPESHGALMRSIRSMEPPISSRDPGPEPVFLPEPDFTANNLRVRKSQSMDPQPSSSGQHKPESFLSLRSFLNKDSPESHGALMRRISLDFIRSMEKRILM